MSYRGCRRILRHGSPVVLGSSAGILCRRPQLVVQQPRGCSTTTSSLPCAREGLRIPLVEPTTHCLPAQFARLKTENEATFSVAETNEPPGLRSGRRQRQPQAVIRFLRSSLDRSCHPVGRQTALTSCALYEAGAVRLILGRRIVRPRSAGHRTRASGWLHGCHRHRSGGPAGGSKVATGPFVGDASRRSRTPECLAGRSASMIASSSLSCLASNEGLRLCGNVPVEDTRR